ncbi:FAD-binding domain-containing protein [Leucogyrophana mollusca]|uniref:FAD-binding domain-containing protein n=1 Tax=Leucogyrophana mollusca TaxID=85980 RepID=A0ACB8B6J8_9AGAM|nr:FAD-binding domain-containing protein [Leucogyrophana mollusca]
MGRRISAVAVALYTICLSLPVTFSAHFPRSLSGALVSLNHTVQGRLHAATPIARPCFSWYDHAQVSPDQQACAIVQENYTSPGFRSLHYGNTMNSEWETCMGKSEQCLLDYNNATNPLAYTGTDCDQGSISRYYIEIQDERDLVAAFAFSKASNVPLSIKNSGHDYKGRSTMKDSLALWTRKLTSLSYNKTFVPQGCSVSSSYNAITTGAGNSFQDLYEFADANNVTYVGGYATTVGASGGWLMGGGHSILSPVLGLGVDRVLEFKIVTPDGELRIANECQNTDLFWALRGGGGGTFGVVLESTSKVEPQLTLQVAYFSFNSTATSLREYYEILVNSSVQWSTEGWGGHIIGSTIIYVTPNLALDEAQNSMKNLSDFITAQGGQGIVETLPSWYSFFEKYGIPSQQSVGVLQAIASRLIPKTNFESANGRSQLVDLLVSLPAIYIPVVPPVLFNATRNATSITPAWRDSLWHLISGAVWEYNSTATEIEVMFGVAHNLTLSMRAIAPDSGAYSNEGDVYEVEHETSFWGPNYPALLQIKQKYDPLGLLDCWQCVGWKGSSSKDFECYLPSP